MMMMVKTPGLVGCRDQLAGGVKTQSPKERNGEQRQKEGRIREEVWQATKRGPRTKPTGGRRGGRNEVQGKPVSQSDESGRGQKMALQIEDSESGGAEYDAGKRRAT
jgi:hypothetical protein